MIDRFERFSYSIFEISRCWHKIASEVMSGWGLKGPHAMYLVTMQRYEQGVTAARLCELCARDKADVSRAVAVLEEKGLITREGSGSYRARLKLTETGRKLAGEVADHARLAVEHAGGGMTDEQREQFYNALESITKNLQTLSRKGLPTAAETRGSSR